MSTTTPNIGLTKGDDTDVFDQTKMLNPNWDILDSKVGTLLNGGTPVQNFKPASNTEVDMPLDGNISPATSADAQHYYWARTPNSSGEDFSLMVKDGTTTSQLLAVNYQTKTVTVGGATGWATKIDGQTQNAYVTSQLPTKDTISSFRAYVGTSQTVPGLTWTKIAYNTKVYDNQTEYDNTTNYRFTAKNAGIYLVCAGVSATNPSGLKVLKNGVDEIQLAGASTTNGSTFQLSGSVFVKLNANDYIEIYANVGNSSPSNITIGINSLTNYFEVIRLV